MMMVADENLRRSGCSCCCWWWTTRELYENVVRKLDRISLNPEPEPSLSLSLSLCSCSHTKRATIIVWCLMKDD